VIRRELLVLGVDLDNHPFKGPIRDQIEAARPRLRGNVRVLLNARSHVDFGWQARGRFRGWEVGRHAVALAGGFTLLRGFAADGAALCGDDTFVRVCDYPSPEVVNFGFLKVRPGTAGATVRALASSLPPDVVPYARGDLLARERDHWVNQTSTGKLFSFGVLVAMIVATAVVYQVLSNDIRDHLPEYATLKAMGYTQGRLARVVVEQALIYMAVSYVIAVGIGAAVYRATEALAGIPMRLTAANLALALALAVAVGLLTGSLSFLRLRAADPADLF
jgi:putative ABC transport system permease protein